MARGWHGVMKVLNKRMKQKSVCKTSAGSDMILCGAFITYSLGFNGVSDVENASVECCSVQAKPVYLNFHPCESFIDFHTLHV